MSGTLKVMWTELRTPAGMGRFSVTHIGRGDKANTEGDSAICGSSIARTKAELERDSNKILKDVTGLSANIVRQGQSPRC